MTTTNPCGRSFTWTLYGYCDIDLRDNFAQTKGLRYAIWQKEMCPTTKRLHYQGYLQVIETMRCSGASKKYLFGKAKVFKSEGSLEDNQKYCSKLESKIDGPWEYGVATTQGMRSDIASFMEDVESGKSIVELYRSAPNLMMRGASRYVKEFRTEQLPTRNWKTEVIVCYGNSGYGKDHWINENINKTSMWQSDGSNWFDGYMGQEDVWIQEFHGTMPYNVFLKIIDKYDCPVQTKGGYGKMVAKRIFISSHDIPSKWYKSEHCEFEPIARRIDKMVYFQEPRIPIFFDNWKSFYDFFWESNKI